ncbi:MAG: hypothetical protein A2V67_00405 [Deltaproteobacteria bacterium RBG_13_61_14]|nr:MAG: hypothetical protein A2V67_00405 [Deltaproteobacteria bacterium RBG_13_61_14]
MEGPTKVVWEFLETAFRTGALDEFLKLSKAVTDKKYENQAELFADLEDAVSAMEDLTSLDQILVEAFRMMPALTDPETLEGMALLLSAATPYVKSFMDAHNRDTALLAEKKARLMAALPKVWKAVVALIMLNSPAILSALGKKSASEYGQSLGRALNVVAGYVNDVHARDPEAVSAFMAGVFKAVDGQQVGKTADVLAQAFLDQRPPLLKWTAATAAKQARKRLLGR